MIGKINLSGSGKGGVFPQNVSDLRIKVDNGKLTVFWGDPDDTVIEGQTVCVWKGTKLVYKAGSYPESVNDGMIILDNQVKNQYKTNGFDVTGLTNGTTYYFSLFPYSDKKAINNNAENRISETPRNYKIMTVNINLKNSNPKTSVTYADDAFFMTPRK